MHIIIRKAAVCFRRDVTRNAVTALYMVIIIIIIGTWPVLKSPRHHSGTHDGERGRRQPLPRRGRRRSRSIGVCDGARGRWRILCAVNEVGNRPRFATVIINGPKVREPKPTDYDVDDGSGSYTLYYTVVYDLRSFVTATPSGLGTTAMCMDRGISIRERALANLR